jgi:hypothetical protein
MIWETSLPEFVAVTLVLGGAGAWLIGRSVARAWLPVANAAVAALPLAAAVRFIHFALFGGTLLSARYYAIDAVILVAVAIAGHRTSRRRQMRRQYPWLAHDAAAAREG